MESLSVYIVSDTPILCKIHSVNACPCLDGSWVHLYAHGFIRISEFHMHVVMSSYMHVCVFFFFFGKIVHFFNVEFTTLQEGETSQLFTNFVN